MGIYVFLSVGLVIVGAFLYFEAQRRNALAGVAAQLGMTFSGGLQRLPTGWTAPASTSSPRGCRNAST